MSKYPGISEPMPELLSIHNTVLEIKQVVELLARQRAPFTAAAVTWDDITKSGLLPKVDGTSFDVFLTNLGTSNSLAILAATFAGLGTVVGVQLFTGNGTYTRAANVKNGLLLGQAPGGGGGGVGTTAGTGRGGGGGAGETRIAVVTPGATETVTVPSGGTGATAGNNSGGTGSDATFGALMTCKGGTGGGGSAGNTDGTNGTTPTGSGGIRIEPTGDPAVGTNTEINKGGSSMFGDGGFQALNVVHPGVAAQGKGGGGSGGFDTGTTSRAGGAGSGGMFVMVELR